MVGKSQHVTHTVFQPVCTYCGEKQTPDISFVTFHTDVFVLKTPIYVFLLKSKLLSKNMTALNPLKINWSKLSKRITFEQFKFSLTQYLAKHS